MEASNEIIDELKASVTAKLNELDPDNTELEGCVESSLINYIIVMVINQKNKCEMKHDLSLFLGKICDDFVNWLFEHLSKLKQSNHVLFGHDSSIDLNIDEQKKKDSKSKNSNKESDKKGNKENQNESKENDHKLIEIDSKKENMKSETNKRKIANKITDVDEPSKRIPDKKLKSVVVNLVNNEENQENGENENQKSRPALRKHAGSNNIIIIKNNSEKYPHNNKEQRLISEDEIDDSILKENKKFISYETVVTKPTLIDNNNKMQTKLFATLVGVKNMFKVDDDLFLMDEELDPELVNEDLPNIDQLSMNKKEKFSVGSNKFERCRYWPSCMNGNKCDYHHPSIKCNMFPNCRFGDKCLYIHPMCKYDSVCSRKDCPFFHTFTANIKRCQLVMNPNKNKVTCKYFPKCAKPNCEFIHPKIVCKYGSACKTINCSYVHPDQNHIPHPHHN